MPTKGDDEESARPRPDDDDDVRHAYSVPDSPPPTTYLPQGDANSPPDILGSGSRHLHLAAAAEEEEDRD